MVLVIVVVVVLVAVLDTTGTIRTITVRFIVFIVLVTANIMLLNTTIKNSRAGIAYNNIICQQHILFFLRVHLYLKLAWDKIVFYEKTRHLSVKNTDVNSRMSEATPQDAASVSQSRNNYSLHKFYLVIKHCLTQC